MAVESFGAQGLFDPNIHVQEHSFAVSVGENSSYVLHSRSRYTEIVANMFGLLQGLGGVSTQQIHLKTVPKLAKMALFVFYWDIAGIGLECNFFGWNCTLDAELQTYMFFLKIPLTG